MEVHQICDLALKEKIIQKHTNLAKNKLESVMLSLALLAIC